MSMKIDGRPTQERARPDPTELRVRRVLGELFQLPAGEISLETSFEELGADSADFVELQILLLEEFGVEIPEKAAQVIRAVDDLVRFVRDRLATGE